MKQDVKAGLEVAVKDWGTGATAGHGNTETTITTSQGRKLSVKYIVEVRPPNLLTYLRVSDT